MPHEILLDPLEPKKPLSRVREWLKPNTVGKFGLSVCIGQREFFLGVSVAKVEVETIITRRKKKVLIKSGSPRIMDY